MNRRRFFQLGTGLATALTRIKATATTGRVTGSRDAGVLPKEAAPRVELKDNLIKFQGNWCAVPDWRMSIEVNGRILRTTNAHAKQINEDPFRIAFHFPKQQLIWEVEGKLERTSGSILLFSRIHNQSKRPLTLGKTWLLQTDQLAGFSAPGNDLVFLPVSSGQQLLQVQKVSERVTLSDVTIQLFNLTQAKALQAGFVSFARCKTQVTCRCDPAAGLRLGAWCDFDGWELAPRTSTPTETLVLAAGENPHTQLEAWAEHASRLCQPRPREWEGQPNGWVGWSWVDVFTVERYQDVVLRNAKAIRRRLAGFGIDYVWISIGNIHDGQPGDWLNWSRKNFPDGHRYLYEQLCHLGFKWGLWCGAFMISSKLQNKVEEFKDALFKQPKRNEPMVYLKRWSYGLDRPHEDFRKPIYALDPSHPKTLEFLRKVFQTYRDWGVRYYMVDFLWAGADTLGSIPHAKHHDRRLVSGPAVLRKGLQAIREACADDTHLLASSGPTLQTVGYMDAVRVGNDFGEGRPLTRSSASYPATSIIDSPRYWTGPIRGLSNQASTYYTHRKLYINNSGNVLTVDKPIPMSHAQVFATIHAMSGGPSMLGDDIEFLDEDRLRLIKQTLPRPTEVAIPVDLFAKRKQDYPRVFHRKVLRPWGSYDVVAVYNLEANQSIEQAIPLERLGLDKRRTYLVWEFWGSEYLGKVQGTLRAELAPYSVKVYRLAENTGHPTLLGTDLHVLMGEMEIDWSAWNAEGKILSGRALRPAGERGNLFVYAPPKVGVANPKGLFLAKDAKDDSLIIRCPLEFKEGWAEWSIKFATF